MTTNCSSKKQQRNKKICSINISSESVNAKGFDKKKVGIYIYLGTQ